MQRIFIPFDASESAKHALEYAIKLAKEHGQIALTIVNVHPEPVIYGEIEVYGSREKFEKEQRAHSLDILQPAVEMAKVGGISFTSDVLVGSTASMIVKRAEELNCIGIVMGTRGMGALGNLVMGSIATKVIHLTRLPVTLVK